MNKLLLSLLPGCLTLSLYAETWPKNYADYGELIVVKLDSAPFPHPDRAKGHQYHEKLFTAEKNYSDNSVAIFVPKGFHPADKVDFVVHFHGWNNHVEKVLSHYQLIQQFAESGRNAVLVVPQGPYDASDSFDGKLEDENGFKKFMSEVMQTLRQREVIKSEPIGTIILSGHSGGYQVMSSIVAKGGLSDEVKEVWLFDALYARTDKFMDWYKDHPGRRMIDIYTEHGGTKGETEKLMASLKVPTQEIPFLFKKESEVTSQDLKKNQLVFLFSELEHDQVVDKHRSFCEYLKTSALAPIK
ncbi:MAG TPA: hypothetical protein VFC07_03790 [Verrucomicrobiae bacterium]|nr:hypothetical protein [Verrucomicrobiae bacterium]